MPQFYAKSPILGKRVVTQTGNSFFDGIVIEVISTFMFEGGEYHCVILRGRQERQDEEVEQPFLISSFDVVGDK